MNTLKDTTSPYRVLDGGSKEKTPSEVKNIDKSDIEITKVKLFDSKIEAMSLTTGNNSAWVMSRYNDTMYLYDSNGDEVRSFKVNDNTGINDMVITRSGDMIVACRDNTVRRVSVAGKISTLINTEHYEPRGVCLTDREEVVVCMRNSLSVYELLNQCKVVVYSPDGRSNLRHIRGVDSRSKLRITDAYRVVCNGKDLCVVNSSNVVCVDDSDNVRWMYGGKQAWWRGSFNPCGICVDKYHNLLVTDYNTHCVHYIERKGGRLIQVILTQKQTGLENPFGICVDDETGNVWVGNNRNNVVVAKYLK